MKQLGKLIWSGPFLHLYITEASLIICGMLRGFSKGWLRVKGGFLGDTPRGNNQVCSLFCTKVCIASPVTHYQFLAYCGEQYRANEGWAHIQKTVFRPLALQLTSSAVSTAQHVLASNFSESSSQQFMLFGRESQRQTELSCKNCRPYLFCII